MPADTNPDAVKVERFGLNTSDCGHQCQAMMESENDGFWVRYSDYKQVQSQLAQVTQERDSLRDEIDGMRAALQS